MNRSWGGRGLGAVALLAAATGCGDDTTGAGGGGGAETTASTASGASVASTSVASTSVASTSVASTGVTTSPSSSGSSSDGGGGSGGDGDGGATTSAQGGSTSEGGGGSTPECVEITIDGGERRVLAASRVAFAFAPNLGESDEPDTIGIGYDDDEGDFELDSVVNDNLATCDQCIVVVEDGDGTLAGAGRVYFQSGGTMTVTEGSAFPYATIELASVTLVEVTFDEDGVSEVVEGGACLTVVDAELEFDIPEEWTCPAGWYGSLDGCDCNCGAPDPDCAVPDQAVLGCGASGPPGDDQPTCSDAGECVAPVDWTCGAEAFFDGEICDCACGVNDPDCSGFDPLPVEGCVDAGAICRAGECVTIPDEWTCSPGFYAGDAFCDCDCGAYDPDCDEPANPVAGCGPGEGCTLEGECGIPASWECDDALWNDGVTCDCVCGANDPDCSLSDPPVSGCEVGEICAQDACLESAVNDACIDAIALAEGTVTGTWVGALNSLDPTEDGCTGFFAIGGDVFYSVSLLAGETLTVTINQPDIVADSSLYLVSDCADADSCVAGIDTAPGQPEELVYTADEAIDLFLVVDQYLNFDQVDFELTVSID